jgi:hypothetical protein
VLRFMQGPPARDNSLREAQRQFKGGLLAFDVTVESLAGMLAEIADKDCGDDKSKAVIRAIVVALTGPQAEQKLILKGKRRGKPVDRMSVIATRADTYNAVKKLKQEGWSMESAVSQVASDEGITVSQVYKRIRED